MFLKILVFVGLVIGGKGCADFGDISKIDFNQAFENFTKQFQRNYSTASERQFRFGVFVQNVINIVQYAKSMPDAQFGVTNFIDWTMEEKRRFVPHVELPNKNNTPIFKLPSRAKRQTLPTNFDWRAYNGVTSVKSQGSCGSCWAFTAAAVVESQWLIHRGISSDLAEQELVDCDKNEYGCSGGFPINALSYILNNGISQEGNYPYRGVQGTCSPQASGKATINGAYWVGDPYAGLDETFSAQVLVQIGPLGHHMAVPDSFFYYQSGVYHPSASECQNPVGYHAITVVGYGVENNLPYWLIKNSWGINWGSLGGYFKMYRGDQTCAMGIPMVVATVPELSTTKAPTTTPCGGCVPMAINNPGGATTSISPSQTEYACGAQVNYRCDKTAGNTEVCFKVESISPFGTPGGFTECYPNYSYQTITCNQGKWVNASNTITSLTCTQTPECKPCSPLSFTINNGVPLTVSPNQASYTCGTTVTYNCARPGSVPVGSKQVCMLEKFSNTTRQDFGCFQNNVWITPTCQNGQWYFTPDNLQYTGVTCSLQ